MSYPEDPEATSVISWGKTSSPTASPTTSAPASIPAPVGRHHHDADARTEAAPDREGSATYRTDSGDEILAAVTGEAVTCPECGTAAHVTLNRRESLDFCRSCDYPLFWAPQKIMRGAGEQSEESLRRLPGQSGRATIASLPCPSCSEPNALDAVRCTRCGSDMHPVADAPPPVVAPRVYTPPPAPEPEPEPGTPGWVWAMVILGALGILAIVVLIATGTIHF